MDCRVPGSSVHGVLQARILKWVAIFFSRGTSWPRDGTRVSCIGRWIFFFFTTGSQDWKRSVFSPIPKKGNAKECSNYHTIALFSYASKVMLKILQVRLQQYVNHELPDVQAGFRKGRNQRSNCQHPLDHQKSKRVPEKHLLLLYWLCQSLWLCGSQ